MSDDGSGSGSGGGDDIVPMDAVATGGSDDGDEEASNGSAAAGSAAAAAAAVGDDDDDDPDDAYADDDGKQNDGDFSEEVDDDEGEDLAGGDDDDDEDDDDDDDDDNERPAKRAKHGAGQFIDDIAEVDDDDDPDDDLVAEEGFKELIDDTLDDATVEAGGDRGHRQKLFADQVENVEEVVAQIKERHRNYQRRARDYRGGSGAGLGSDLDLARKLPSVRDPKLWLIRVKPGQENNLVVALMNKAIAERRRGEPLMIQSVVAAKHLKGYIYVEAHKKVHVRTAVTGMRDLMAWTLKLVPIKEMPEVLTVKGGGINVEAGKWARIRRGKFRGDLAFVLSVDSSGNSARCRLLPRIDLGKYNNSGSGRKFDGTDGAEGNKKRKRRAERPEQKLFNPDEIAELVSGTMVDFTTEAAEEGTIYTLEGDEYRNGFLEKRFKLNNINAEDPNPTLEEIQQHSQAAQSGGGSGENTTQSLAALSMSLPKVSGSVKEQTFKIGDIVHVVKGELAGLMGEVKSIHGGTVAVMPHHKEINDVLTFPKAELRKFFVVGDHVKVVAGKFEGETGHIVRVEGQVVYLISDLNGKELRVFSRDAQESNEVATGLDAIGEYELHDLVTFGPRTSGVIVRVQRDSFKILDHTGVVRTVMPDEVLAKEMARHRVCLDMHNNQVAQRSVVRVMEGPHKGRTGTVRQMMRSYIWLHSRDVAENGGIFVVKARDVELRGGRQTNRPGDQYSSLQGGNPYETSNRASNAPAFGNRLPPGSQDMLYKTVRILTGPFKGYLGVVKSLTDSFVRVELHSKPKTVSVDLDKVVQVENKVDNRYSYDRFTSTPQRGMTPLHGAATPMHEYAPGTPAYAPATPSRPNTPSWTPGGNSASTPGGADDYNPADAFGSNPSGDVGGDGFTPGSYSAYDTGNTPGGGYTPNTYGTGEQAYDPMAPSPAYVAASSPAAFTPYGGGNTPSGYGATTPSGGYDAPTPNNYGAPGGAGGGAYGAPTPSYYGDNQASTPYAAATPYAPSTPSGGVGTPTSGGMGGAGAGGPMEFPSAEAREPWVLVGVEINFVGGQHAGQNGTITAVMAGNRFDVQLSGSGEIVETETSITRARKPRKNDPVVGISGNQQGMRGTLLNINGDEAVVRFDNGVQILPMSSLAKVKA